MPHLITFTPRPTETSAADSRPTQHRTRYGHRLLAALGALAISAGAAAQVALDSSFAGTGKRTVSFDLDSSASDGARRIFPTAGGGYLVVGQASDSGVALALTRLTASGAVDLSFGTSGKRSHLLGVDAVVDVAQDSQGRVVFVGTQGVSGGSDVFVGRLLPSGEVDAGFGFLGLARINVQAQDEVLALAIGPQDQVLALLRTRENSALGWAGYVASLDASGQNPVSAVVSGMPEGGSGAVAWSSGRNALLVGLSSSGSQTCNLGLYQVSLSGSGAGQQLASSFVGGIALSNTSNGCTQARINAVSAVPGSGAALMAGQREDPSAPGSGRQRGMLLRFTAGGGFDPGFNGNSVRVEPAAFPATDLVFRAVTVDPQGRILAAGDSRNSAGPTSAFALWRYLTNGTPDTSFNSGSAQIFTSFPAANGLDSALAAASDLRLLGPRILIAGRSRWTGVSDDDFAVAAFTTPDASLFNNGFEP